MEFSNDFGFFTVERYMLIVLGKIAKLVLRRLEAFVKYEDVFSLRFLSTDPHHLPGERDVPSHWVARKIPDLFQVIECPKLLIFHWSGPETSTPHFFSCGGFKSGPPQAFLVGLYESYHCRDANLKNPACGGLGCCFLNRASRGGGIPAPVPLSVLCPKSSIF